MPTIRHKAFAYITHGDRLLVFRHPFAPEAGIQVPAGTIRAGERSDDAVMREAREETGLPDLVIVRFLGEQRYDLADYGRDEVHHRHFYHLRCAGQPPATWRHEERDPADGTPGPIVFEFFWARLQHEVPNLIAGHDALLPTLIARLADDGVLDQTRDGNAPACRAPLRHSEERGISPS